MALPHDGDTCAFACVGISRSSAPAWSRRADVRGARMRALKPTSNRGSQAPRGDGRRVAGDRHLRRVRPRHGRACASVNATLNDAGSSSRGVEESPHDRESGVRSFTRSLRAQQPDAMLWGALESCPEGDDLKRAPHALCAMRRMCRAAQTRDINIRLPKSRVNLVFSAREPTRKPAIAQKPQVVPRTGVVNARRPGLVPGRSAAESIDDAEHGTRLERAMVQARNWYGRSSHGFRKKLTAHLANMRADFSCWLSGETRPRAPADGRRVSS